MAAHTVHTVGHSTRSAEEFVELLREFCVQELVDIRTVPRSRTDPQFDLDELPGTLGAAGTGHPCRTVLGRRPATPRDFAVVDGDRITYPGGERCST
ncbi:DUF488 family protein [Kocuria sabuli]|uniref:DUF488 family protein n=1 Tax=Kocuria sabuli TaxID=3071448 RepID=UPI0034D790CA